MKKLKQLNLKIEINKGFKVANPAEQPKEDKVTISLRHGTKEYSKRIAHFGSLGAVSSTLVAAYVEADKQVEGEGVSYEEISLDSEDYKEVIDGIKADLIEVFSKKENLTPEQQRIAELEEKIKSLSSDGNSSVDASAENERIKELELKNAEISAKLDAILAGQNATGEHTNKGEAPTIDEDLDEITKLRGEYKDLTDQEPDQRWKESRLKKEIENAKQNK